MLDTDSKGRLGVHKCGAFFAENGMIFRELPTSDYGIDGLVEEKINGSPSGNMFFVQIKYGNSHLSEPKSDNENYHFYFSQKHKKYWLNSILNVVVIVFLENDGQGYWQHVTELNIISAGMNHNLIIPKNRKLNIDNLNLMKELFREEKFTVKALNFLNGINANIDSFKDGTVSVDSIDDLKNDFSVLDEFNTEILKVSSKYLQGFKSPDINKKIKSHNNRFIRKFQTINDTYIIKLEDFAFHAAQSCAYLIFLKVMINYELLDKNNSDLLSSELLPKLLNGLSDNINTKIDKYNEFNVGIDRNTIVLVPLKSYLSKLDGELKFIKLLFREIINQYFEDLNCSE